MKHQIINKEIKYLHAPKHITASHIMLNDK